MASNISLASVTEATTPLDEQVNVHLDFYQLLYNYLRLLRFDTKTMSIKHHIKFDKDLFKVPNQKAFQYVVHFLFTKLDGSRTLEVFRDVWPIVDKKQEQEFRKKVKLWLVEIQESNKDTFQFGHINPSMFLSPGGEKFAQLMCALASHILNKMPKKSHGLSPPPTISNKNLLGTQFKLQIIRGNLLSEFESWIKMTNTFQDDYNQYKLLSRELVAVYRELCQEKVIAEKELCSTVEQSSLSNSQKQSLFDANNNGAELASEIEEKQDYLNSRMKELLDLEKPFQESWNIINSVIAMKKGRPSINGGKLINSFPADFIERYQNIHSGTRLELQKKDGRYDLVPLLSLVLFSVTTAREVSNSLNLPPLEGEMVKLDELKKSTGTRSEVAGQLCTRWSKIFNEQTEAIDKMLTSKFQGNVPMALQSVTPFRSVLVPDKNSAEATTPAVLRAALGMTPVEMGAKAKMRLNQLNSGRPSLDLLLTRRPAARDAQLRINVQNANNGRPVFEKPEMRIIDKRRSQDNGRPGLELCRKKSLTPESSRHSPLNRTPIGSLYLPAHTRVSRPSSLAASPVVERVMQLESSFGGPPSQKQQRARRSLPQIAQQLEAAALVTPRMTQSSAVWEQAAETIVYDLVSFESPVAPTHGFIDPNSSFEKCAFVSRNLIQRSPQQPDEENKASSNLDLLKVLETKFVSPRRSSLLSRPGSRNNSPLPQENWMDSTGIFDYDKEKGLLDASSASLIDDILDFSLGLS